MKNNRTGSGNNALPHRDNTTIRRAVSACLSGVVGALSMVTLSAHAAILNIPTGASTPSPLFGATPFSARMVLFEEFGTEAYKDANGPIEDQAKTTLPRPLVDPVNGKSSQAHDAAPDCYGNPSLMLLSQDPNGIDAHGSLLDSLLGAKGLYPLPGAQADTTFKNPWDKEIKDCLSQAGNGEYNASDLPGDGRPLHDFVHQRWSEFEPDVSFKSMLAGARASGGVRDGLQSHGYGKKTIGKFSEFAPGGLYHNTAMSLADANAKRDPITKKAPYDGTSRGIPVQVHPKWPIQQRNSVWTFDGTIPPKLLMSRYGESILFRNYNALPIVLQNITFGTHTISTHAHNLHNPAESDGYAGAWFYPGQHFDYRWPMALAGHDTINTSATDPRAAMPCTPGEVVDGKTCPASGSIKIPGDYRETQSTLWFHDHMEDYTAQNVYKGNAAMMNVYSAVDRGNETTNCRATATPDQASDNVNLCFPSGSARSWGNRDYDMNLVVADKAFDQLGQLWFNPLNKEGFLGDVMTVNWVYKPYIEVRARRYRFRILDGSVSRYMQIAVVDDTGKAIPFYMIANDGNILEHSLLMGAADTQVINGVSQTLQPTLPNLPTQSIAERYDIIIDFAKLAPGRKVYLVNLMEHATGIGPKAPVTLAQAWNAGNKAAKGYIGEDLAVGKFMEFRIQAQAAGQTDQSMKPWEYLPKVTRVNPTTRKNELVAGKVMAPMPTFTTAELQNARHRTFVYGKRADTDPLAPTRPWVLGTDGGEGLNADLDRVSAAPTIPVDKASAPGSVEIWHLVSPAGGWSHPAHVHFEEGRIIAKKDIKGASIAVPLWEQYGRKDMYRLGPEQHSSAEIHVAIRVREFTGTYVEHCHNTQHEDNAMLLRWDAISPNHEKWVQTPHPDWAGAHNDPIADPYLTYPLDAAGPGTTITGSKNPSTAKNFVLPAGWGSNSADVPATANPAP